MRILSIIFVLLLACTETEKPIVGKWYTYAESGDYMELWLSEDKAMSYLSGVDEFLLYDLKRDGQSLKFSLIESRIINSHEFELKILKKGDQLLQATFVSETKTDSLKTYFLISDQAPDLKGSLAGNKENMEELFSRMEDSHAGHGH